jgi:hypothetical protein
MPRVAPKAKAFCVKRVRYFSYYQCCAVNCARATLALQFGSAQASMIDNCVIILVSTYLQLKV